jgi:uncharacterized coiled-coil protein SlyX
MTESERTSIARLEERINVLIKRIDSIPETVACQSTEIKNLKDDVSTLYNRAWGLLAGFILALIGVIAAFLKS